MQLKSVLLPEPFGPMIATISLVSTAKLTSSFATRPPKRLVSLSTSSSATTQPQSDDSARQEQAYQHDGQPVDQQIEPFAGPAHRDSHAFGQRYEQRRAEPRTRDRSDAAEDRY